MSTPTSTPDGPTDYPDNWKPRHVRERDAAAKQQLTEMELHLAAMDPTERAAMLRRIGVAE